MHVIYLSASRKEVLKEFLQNFKPYLLKHRKKYEHRIPHFETAVSKIEIKWGHPELEKLNALLHHESIEMNNLWFYKLKGGNVIAFADNSVMNSKDTQPHYGTSFSYSETVKKSKEIEAIWNDLEAK